MGRLMDLLFGARETATPATRTLIGFQDGGLISAGAVTGTTALGLSSVWRCLDILSNGVSQLDWMERRGNLDLPPSRIVLRPQQARTRREWTSYVVSCLALYDVAYLLKVGGLDSEGVPRELIPVDPRYVQPIIIDTLGILAPDEYYIGVTKVPADALVILRRSPQPGVLDGLGGVINLARVTFAAALSAEGYASRYWQAGGSPTTVLETDQQLTPTAAQTLSDLWFEKRSRGPDYAPVMSSGLKARSFGADPTAESAVEARRELVADIGRYFGVPTRILNAPTGDSQTYHTSEAANQDLVRYTLQNYISAVQDAISDLLPGGRRMQMFVEPLTEGVQLNRYQAYQYALGGAAWLTPADVRDMENLPPIETPNDVIPPASGGSAPPAGSATSIPTPMLGGSPQNLPENQRAGGL